MADFGAIFIAINIILVGGQIATIGYDVTVLRLAPSMYKEGELPAVSSLLKEARTAALLGGVMIGLLIYLVAWIEQGYISTLDLTSLTLIACSIVITGIMAIHRDVLRSSGMLASALLGSAIIRPTLPLLVCILLAIFDDVTVNAALTAYTFGLLCGLAFEFQRISSLRLPKTAGLTFHNLRIAAVIWPGDAAGSLFLRAASIIVAFTIGIQAAGLYLAAERIAQLGTFLTDAVRTAVGPAIARASIAGRQEQVSLASVLMLASGIVGGITLGGLGWVFLWFFGPEYLAATPILWLLLLAQVSWTVFGATALVMNISGLEKERTFISIITAMVLIGVLIFARTGIQTAVLFCLMCWLLNLWCWAVLRTRANLTSGVFSIERKDLLAVYSQVKKLKSKFQRN